jgi:AraC family transcriptional activator of pobA
MINTQAIQIDDISQAYGCEWQIKDFLVISENCPSRIINRPFRVDGFILAICLQGEISLEVNGELQKAGKKNTFISQPLQLINVIESSEDCRVLLIIFSKPFLISNGIAQHVIDKLQCSQTNAVSIVELNQSEAWSIEHQFKAIWERAQETSHPFRTQVVVSLLLVLLHDLDAWYRKYSLVQHMHLSRSVQLTQQFSALVQSHFREKHEVSFYAKKLHVTPKYLSATIKETTGKTASAIISDTLSIEAQALIKLENLSVKEAAVILHFPDQSTFGKFFKRAVGLSPVEYRKQA